MSRGYKQRRAMRVGGYESIPEVDEDDLSSVSASLDPKDLPPQAHSDSDNIFGNGNDVNHVHRKNTRDGYHGEKLFGRRGKSDFIIVLLIFATVLGILGVAHFHSFTSNANGGSTSNVDNPNDNGNSSTARSSFKRNDNLYDEHGRYILEDYDIKPTFSDFLPGVAGLYGKPMWAFYVNRGQGIASFGTVSKETPILEFNAANKAYQNTPLLGFRTFITGRRGDHSFFSEPFSPLSSRVPGSTSDADTSLPKRVMYVGANEMQIQETNFAEMYEINVTYFVLPEESFSSFVRRTTITNMHETKKLTLSGVLDGLAQMEPYGGRIEHYLKETGRTLESWFGVYHVDDDNKYMPFYKMSYQPFNVEEVSVENAGHYCISFIEGDKHATLPIVFDRDKVFGADTTLLRPTALMNSSVSEILSNPQYGFAKTSSAFAAAENINLDIGESVTITSFYGKAEQITDVPIVLRSVFNNPGLVQYKFIRAREVIDQLTSGISTNTGSSLFNAYVKQVYMDNCLTGGISLVLGDIDDHTIQSNADQDERLKVCHVFSRKRGDLERDFSNFKIDPTYFSQGSGNFRDIIQSRRNDVIFNPRIGSANIQMFLSFIQADGYEPDTVEAAVFTIDDPKVCGNIATRAVGPADGHRAQRESLERMLCNGSFRPGQLFEMIEEKSVELIMDRQKFIDLVLSSSDSSPMGVFGDGYWADHWTYYLDLINNYLSIYPEQEEALMFQQNLKYFFSPASVYPRSKRYVLLKKHGKKPKVVQVNATFKDKMKVDAQNRYLNSATGLYTMNAHWQHDKSGRQYESSPIVKLFLLGTLKFATRDAYGMGIEYEAGKPGLNDSMYGLVGMIGSGMAETYELQLLLQYVLSVVQKYQVPIDIPVELATLVDQIEIALNNLLKNGSVSSVVTALDVPKRLFHYWNVVSSARESYRESVRVTFSGAKMISPERLIMTLERWLKEIEMGIIRAHTIISNANGDNGTSAITPTYFAYTITEWRETGFFSDTGRALVDAIAMSLVPFPLFLEGPMRMMKTASSSKQALEIYKNVKTSSLRDENLSMYTISANLSGLSQYMGSVMALAQGWHGNQSVSLQMSYKYYLELIRNKLYDVFFDEMTEGGMLPFMDPDIYGRSPIECSSFIASSAFHDPSVQGRGFMGRLSGSTPEFLSMWVLMFIGPKPFSIDERTNALSLSLIPALPKWLFGSSNQISFKLFGSINVTYRFEDGGGIRNLFDESPKRYLITRKDGSSISVKNGVIPDNPAREIRNQVLVDAIDAYF